MAEVSPLDIDAGHDAPDARALALRRCVVFCVVALALAGATAIVLASTGGLADSRVLVPGTPVTVALVLLPTAYMFSPAAAHVATRLITREGWSGTGLRPRLRGGRWRWWLLAWFAPAGLTVVGAVLCFALLPATFDPGVLGERMADAERSVGGTLPISVGLLVVLQLVAAVTVAPVVNAVVAFGEELGWRGYLQPHLTEVLGVRRAVLVTGLVWGAWHWPLIAMGYEYGDGYPGDPWPGMLVFLLFTVSAGTLLGVVAVRGGGVWPAALGHGAVNAVAALPLLVAATSADVLVGPLPIGVLGVVPWAVVAVVLLRRWPRQDGAGVGPTDGDAAAR